MPLKQAQSEWDNSSSLDPVPEGAKIRDLMQALDNDWSINSLEKIRLLAEIKRLTNNAPGWTSLGNVMYGAFGALFGNLVTKYFGMGVTGRTIATLVGAGLGSGLYNRSHTQSAGWRNI
jgi:uncharacterized membrane protein YeaQ/YmgE (transglycosylase-associated protein family)